MQQKTKATDGSMIDEWKLENASERRYLHELVETYGFTQDIASLIISLYDRIDVKYANESNAMKAWRYSRLLGGVYYNHEDDLMAIMWNDLAGNAMSGVFSEEAYFLDRLNYSSSQYELLKSSVTNQHNQQINNMDFAHMQMALAARLAYYNNCDGFASNLFFYVKLQVFTGENVSYCGGWLGDAAFLEFEDSKTSIGNGDYCADLDAENIYQNIIQNEKYIDAIASYYSELTSSRNRADIFLGHISYYTVEALVLDGLDMNSVSEIKSEYPDTYDFLMSLKDHLPTLGSYA